MILIGDFLTIDVTVSHKSNGGFLNTMINGRLYDTETMNEIGNYNKVRSKFYWENNKYNRSFDWHEMNRGIGEPKCVCGY